MNDWQRNVLDALVQAGLEEPQKDADRIIEVASESENPSEAALEMLERRLRGDLLEYVIGRVRFMDIEMLAEPGALIPRLETEILGRGAESRIRALGVDGELRIIDMCCGEGNLACALAIRFPNARVWASDLTDGCVRVARKNVQYLALQERVKVWQGDLFSSLEGQDLEATIHAIVCNPPYISTGRLDKDRAHLLEHEPVEAFDGGPYGLTIHQRVIKEGLPFLRSGGILGFEFGVGQERQIELLFRRAKGMDSLEFDCDADGLPRAAFTRKKGE